MAMHIGSIESGRVSPLFDLSTKTGNYQFHLHSTVKQLGLREENWNDLMWADLSVHVTQNYLDSVAQNRGAVAKLFRLLENYEETEPQQDLERFCRQIELDPKLSRMKKEDAMHILMHNQPKYYHGLSREREKYVDRVVAKYNERVNGLAKGYDPRYFTVVNDFLAFTIPLWDLKKFPQAIEHIEQIARDNGGMVYVRGKNRWGNCVTDDGKWKDIVQFVHVYLPEYGLIEFQVAHPMARHAFDRNSELRNHPELKGQKIKLFDDGFYKLATQYLVDEANGCFKGKEEMQLQRQDEMVNRAIEIHHKANVQLDEETKFILNLMCGRSLFVSDRVQE